MRIFSIHIECGTMADDGNPLARRPGRPTTEWWIQAYIYTIQHNMLEAHKQSAHVQRRRHTDRRRRDIWNTAARFFASTSILYSYIQTPISSFLPASCFQIRYTFDDVCELRPSTASQRTQPIHCNTPYSSNNRPPHPNNDEGNDDGGEQLEMKICKKCARRVVELRAKAGLCDGCCCYFSAPLCCAVATISPFILKSSSSFKYIHRERDYTIHHQLRRHCLALPCHP